MPDVNSIPFRQANGNGHYESKQLPNDNTDFLAILGLPVSLGNVTSVTVPSRDGQLVQYWQTGGLTVKGSTAIGIVDLVDGVVTTRLSPTGDIVGTLGAQTLNNKTLTNCVLATPTGLTKTDVGLGNVDNTSDVNKPVSTATQLQLNLKENAANKGVANGYAGLDAGGKVPVGQMPLSVVGAVNYQGTWNAATNTPTIPAAAAGNEGWYYVVNVAGTTIISGVGSWAVGDWLVSNGGSWDKVDNTDAVASVAGKVGAVVLDRTDVGLGNVDNTSDAAKNSAVGVLTNKTINGASNSLTVRLENDVAGNLPITNLNNGIGAAASTWWCGDGQWKSPAGAGDVVGPGGAIDGEISLFSGATGKLLKRATGTGIVNVVNGLYQVPLSVAATIHLPRGYLGGMTLANNATDATNDVDITVGECRDDGNAADIVLASPLTKQLDVAWAAGTGVGGRDTGAIADLSWHVFAIRNPTSGVCDVLFSQSVSAPTMPSGFTQKRRIGAIWRAAGVISPFRQLGDYFQPLNPFLDVNDAQPLAGASFTITLSVPMGLRILAHVVVRAFSSTSASNWYLRTTDQGAVPGQVNDVMTPAGNVAGGGQYQIWTTVSRTLQATFANGTAVAHFSLATIGYWDYRGKQD